MCVIFIYAASDIHTYKIWLQLTVEHYTHCKWKHKILTLSLCDLHIYNKEEMDTCNVQKILSLATY
jgi:hypothetical protein